MKKCRYIPRSELPQTATDEEVDAILAALNQGRYKVVGLALRYVVQVWKMNPSTFAAAICAHLESGHLLFHKIVSDPPEDTLLFDANIGRDPDYDDEEDDVYVEIRLQNGVIVIICDAHNHTTGQPRLPKMNP